LQSEEQKPDKKKTQSACRIKRLLLRGLKGGFHPWLQKRTHLKCQLTTECRLLFEKISNAVLGALNDESLTMYLLVKASETPSVFTPVNETARLD